MSEYCAPEETLGTVAFRRPHQRRMSVVRRVSNLPIRVPSTDWPAVVTGRKGMFRTYNGSGLSREHPVVPPETVCPRPCLLFTERQVGPDRLRQWLAAPGVLLAHRVEPLGSITPEDLEREGHPSLPAFRYYWRQRHRAWGWRPWDMVSVIEVRPWKPADREEFGDWAISELFGEWFDDHNPRHDP